MMHGTHGLRRALGGVVFLTAWIGLAATAVSAPAWTRQIGTATDDAALSVTADGEGNVYVAGYAGASLCGSQCGNGGAWVAKYDADGTRLWLHQPVAPTADWATGVAADVAENVYVVGSTSEVPVGSQYGDEHAFLAKYGPNGTRLWTWKSGASAVDSAAGVATDTGNSVYLAGSTGGTLAGKFQGGFDDAWVAKYDADGKRVWARQLGSDGDDSATGVAIDRARNVYVIGSTNGSLGGAKQGQLQDAWLAKYNTQGARQWIRHISYLDRTDANAVATDSQRNVYVTGEAGTCCVHWHMEISYPWITKYDAQGRLQWTQELHLEHYDGLFWQFAGAHSVAIDMADNIYLAGYVSALDFPKGDRADEQVWLAKFDASGAQVWLKRVGVAKSDDSAASVATDVWGNILLAGSTQGALAGPYHGGTDAFLVKYPADQ